MNNTPWTSEELAGLKVEFEKANQPMAVFARNYHSKTGRSYNAIRVKITTQIQAGEIKSFYMDKSPARILVLDIETLPLRVFSWGIHEQHLTPDNVQEDYCIATWAATWLYSGEIQSMSLTPQEARNRADLRILDGMWQLMDRADILIAHYGKYFDIPKLNARFFKYDIIPPSPYKIIDTKTDIPDLGLTSKKLDYIARYKGMKEKIKTDYALWVRCVDGEKSALKEMETYNRQDVVVLEGVYTVLRPWIRNHPDVNIYEDVTGTLCPTCGEKITWGGRAVAKTQLYPVFRCDSCGTTGRGKWA